MRIVHAADLHVDSPLRGLERYEGAPLERARGATRRALQQVVDICLAERASFLVLAGDVFDSDWKDVRTGLFFRNALVPLREIGCRVLLLRGNHDFELTRALTPPDHVHTFAPATAEPGPGDRERHTFAFENEGVVFHGLSYPEQHVRRSLLPQYPRPIAGLVNVGVLHTNASGSLDHAPYAPCSTDELVRHGYDYWALGHVHGRAVLHEEPWIVYPGNTQGRSVRETGGKGCVVLEVSGGSIRTVKFVDTDVLRWFNERIVLSEGADLDVLLERASRLFQDVERRAAGRTAAVRLLVTGSCPLHTRAAREPERITSELRALALDRGGQLWLEKVALHTAPPVDLAALRASSGLVGELLRDIQRLRSPAGEMDLLARSAVLMPLERKLGRELAAIDLSLQDPEWLRSIVTEAEALLIEHLGVAPASSSLPAAVDRQGHPVTSVAKPTPTPPTEANAPMFAAESTIVAMPSTVAAPTVTAPTVTAPTVTAPTVAARPTEVSASMAAAAGPVVGRPGRPEHLEPILDFRLVDPSQVTATPAGSGPLSSAIPKRRRRREP